MVSLHAEIYQPLNITSGETFTDVPKPLKTDLHGEKKDT